jgi:tetratricopeptide (TPR) repeat protein
MTVVSCQLREAEGVDKQLVAKFFRSALGAIKQQGYVFSHSESGFDLVFSDALVGVHWCGELSTYFLNGRGPKGLGVGIGMTLGMTYRVQDSRSNRFSFEGATVEWARRYAAAAGENQMLSGDVLWANMRRHAYSGRLHLEARSLGVHRFAGVEGAREVMELRPTGFETHTYAPIGTLGTNITNLMDDPGVFTGREPELSAIQRLFEEGQNLVTIVGAPGMGASRLAARYGALQLGEYPGGVWACTLQDISTAGGMLGRLAQVLRLQMHVSGIGSSGKVSNALAERPSSLIILDGIDGLQEVCSLTLGVWKDRAPNIDFLVTSHSRIGLSGECVLSLEPMSPKDGLALFLRCARDAGTQMLGSESETECIEKIIKRVDGMPLGIVLAAGWTDMMSVSQLEARLHSGLGLLSRRRPGSRAGQRTLTTAMSYAWNNLSIEQRSLLGQCSIFRSPFTVEDVEAVVEMHRFPNPEAVVELLHGICERSLARSSQRKNGEVVFEMYAASREYGRQHLATSGEQRAIMGRLSEHIFTRAQKVIDGVENGMLGYSYADLEHHMEALEDVVENEIRPGDAGRAVLCMEPYLLATGSLAHLEQLLRQVSTHSTNQVPVKVSIELLRAQGDLHVYRGDLNKAEESYDEGLKLISSALGRELEWKLHLHAARVSVLQAKPEAVEAIENVLNGSGASEERGIHAAAQVWKARLLLRHGQFEDCYEVISSARLTAKELRRVVTQGDALMVLAALERRLGQSAKGAEDCASAEDLFLQVSDEMRLASVWLEQARLELDYDNAEAARKRSMQARAFFMTQGMRRPLGKANRILGMADHLSGKLRQALEHYQESARLLKDSGDLYQLGLVRWDMGRVLQESGHAAEARSQFEEAMVDLREAQAVRAVALVEASLATLQAEEGQIGDSNLSFKRAASILRQTADPVGTTLCKLYEAQLQLAQAWRVGPNRGPALRAKAMDTYRSMREPGTKPARTNGRPVEVRLLLRLLRRRIKQASN